MSSDAVSQETSNGSFETPEPESRKGSVSTVWTPGLSSSVVSLSLNRGSFKHTIFVPSAIHVDAIRLRDDFLASLPEITAGLTQGSEPSSVLELVARFLRHIQQHLLHSSHDQGTTREVLDIVFTHFEMAFVKDDDVHVLVASLPDDPPISYLQRLSIIEAYYSAQFALERPLRPRESNLLRAARNGQSSVFVIFGGQGNTDYFNELSETYVTYSHLVVDFVDWASEILNDLSKDPKAAELYSRGLHATKWLQKPDEQPDTDYLTSAPVSFPLIGLYQLTVYMLTCKLLGLTPGQFRKHLNGVSGHSQGIVTAVAVSMADSWSSFQTSARTALTLLFWIGLRSQQATPRIVIDPSVVQESVRNNEGTPTSMLGIRDLPRNVLEDNINVTNAQLPKDKHVSISLVNSARNFVVSGRPQSLCGLNARLRRLKPTPGLDQNRVPFSKRKVNFTTSFLPITAPFHSPYLVKACEIITADVSNLTIASRCLDLPVYRTDSGKDLRLADRENIVPEIVQMITCNPVNWRKATSFSKATHIIDFGPGRFLGVGIIAHQDKDGNGVRVVAASIGGKGTKLGSKEEIFDCNKTRPVKYAANWLAQYGPSLVKTTTGQVFVNTKFSRLTGLPPIMVAGMTPCTVHWDFVATTMNSGFHVELAGGGYHSPQPMMDAIRKISTSITPGRAITINLIYVAPQAIAWQIPLIKQLKGEGLPIDGITIGAGIPSFDVANDWIADLGLRHISFKPSSIEAIQQVINIAQANRDFPVILQWTGGRGGGHHSFEDFHNPILHMYSRIRECSNIVLVAGSGFGGSDDTYPYLTGQWASKFDHSPMPFDGILFGSRMMTAREAHSSTAVKQAIVDAAGSEDSQWEQTYQRPIGGVMTVLSEMREPIHMLATRGVRFWAEMDEKIFSLERSKRVAALQRKRGYIIDKLNCDYQKVWFGKDKRGKPVDIDEMTMEEVLRRMADLLYIKHQSRWIDASYKALIGDFVRRIEERFNVAAQPSIVQSYHDIEDPWALYRNVIHRYPRCRSQLISTPDAEFFILLCRRGGQKPVPFVPALDDNFELWFKKDSLWYSEDLDAVVGQDAGRTCILQGPVAAKYAQTADEPIKEILERISESHINELNKDMYETGTTVPLVGHFGRNVFDSYDTPDLDSLEVSTERDMTSYTISQSASFTASQTRDWLRALGGSTISWRYALFASDTIVQGTNIVENPFRKLFGPIPGSSVRMAFPDNPSKMIVTLRASAPDGHVTNLIEVRATSQRTILLTLFEHRNATGKAIGLPLIYTYHPETGFAPIREFTHGRNDRIKAFYHRLWFGDENTPAGSSVLDEFHGGTVSIDRQSVDAFTKAVGNTGEAYVGQDKINVPMDFAIKAAWKAMTKPLFIQAIDGDLLTLVHLRNEFRMVSDASPLEIGDVVEVVSRIESILIQDTGKMVEVRGSIIRNEVAIMTLTSQFLFRGTFSDYNNTFQRRTEPPVVLHLDSAKDVARLQSREWFHAGSHDTDFFNKSLTFELESLMWFKSKKQFNSIHTEGRVFCHSPAKERLEVAKVDYMAGESYGNPVVDYLERFGVFDKQQHVFDNPIPISGDIPLSFMAPVSNENYARVSGDYNPIHVSRTFASYAHLDRPITHGMYTSAAVRGLVEVWAAENDVERVRSFKCSFTGMVMPNDQIEVKLWHVGMVQGRKVVKAEAFNSSGDKVLEGEAEVEQPASAYLFTGQGSQHVAMGMDLYAQNEVARATWDRADKHLMERFGFSILHIVKDNPKSLTVRFGGLRGRAIRGNYMNLMFENTTPDGQVISSRIFKDIDEHTDSYVHRSPEGLLYSTQFAQPALVLMAKANFEVLKARGVVQEKSSFAGHSLGEYAALSAFSDFMSVEDLAEVVFYRGLMMQSFVETDENGRTNYGMCAVNPSRVSPNFDQAMLRYVVQTIQDETDWLLEIVNLNIRNMQYTCAGDLRALDILTSLTNHLNTHPDEIPSPSDKAPSPSFLQLIRICIAQTQAKPYPLELQRGVASTPLHGINVPFHSTMLRSGVRPFRSILQNLIKKSSVDARKLVQQYVPNLTGKPFEISKEYFEEVGRLTASPEIANVLRDWDRPPSASSLIVQEGG